MRRLVVMLIILLVSVLTGLEISRHPGYLLLVYHSWMVQMPLWVAALSLIFTFVAFYIVIDSVDRLQFLWFRIKNAWRIRKEHAAYNKTQRGLALLIEGNWAKAEKLLLSGVSQSMDPLMNYLSAAKAAHEQRAWDRRDRYIKKAYEVAPEAEIAIGITQAEFLLSQDQLEQALAMLNRLRSLAPKQVRVLKLLERAYVRLGDWQNLQLLLPVLRKTKILSGTQTQQFERNLYADMFRTDHYKTLDDLKASWNAMPKNIRHHSDVVLAYTKQLVHFHQTEEAAELIRKSLKQEWSPALVNLYGTLPLEDINRQLVIVGGWLKTYGQHAETLLLLGQLCVKAKLWGKAKDYFEKCLALCPSNQASLAYAQLLLQLGETDKAIDVMSEGLSI
jgi:HemY protein